MILFRTDATPQIGFGHLTRCRALAYAVREQGESSVMVGPDQTYANKDDARLFDVWLPQAWSEAEADAIHLAALAEQFGAKKLALDDYRVNEAYQRVLRDKGLKWLQFEARTTHPIWADIVLNASPAAKVEDYTPVLRNPDAQLLLGPRYAVLRPEFASVEPLDPMRPIKRVLVTFGGGDDRGALLWCLKVLSPMLGEHTRLQVISGQANPRNAENLDWVAKTRQPWIEYAIQPPAPWALMSECHMAVMASGTTAYEANCCRLPMVLMSVVNNQHAPGLAWQQAGQAQYLGSWETVSESALQQKVAQCMQDIRSGKPDVQTLVDGLGANRVAQAIQNFIHCHPVETL